MVAEEDPPEVVLEEDPPEVVLEEDLPRSGGGRDPPEVEVQEDPPNAKNSIVFTISICRLILAYVCF